MVRHGQSRVAPQNQGLEGRRELTDSMKEFHKDSARRWLTGSRRKASEQNPIAFGDQGITVGMFARTSDSGYERRNYRQA